MLTGGLLLGMVLIVLVSSFQNRIAKSITSIKTSQRAGQHAGDCLVEARTKSKALHFRYTEQDITDLCAPEIKAAKAAATDIDKPDVKASDEERRKGGRQP